MGRERGESLKNYKKKQEDRFKEIMHLKKKREIVKITNLLKGYYKNRLNWFYIICLYIMNE